LGVGGLGFGGLGVGGLGFRGLGVGGLVSEGLAWEWDRATTKECWHLDFVPVDLPSRLES
jgi:hypothetical protein